MRYDISDAKRQREVALCREGFGYRKQFSVFLYSASAADFVRLRSRLYDMIDLADDQMLFTPRTESGRRIEAIGRSTRTT